MGSWGARGRGRHTAHAAEKSTGRTRDARTPASHARSMLIFLYNSRCNVQCLFLAFSYTIHNLTVLLQESSAIAAVPMHTLPPTSTTPARSSKESVSSVKLEQVAQHRPNPQVRSCTRQPRLLPCPPWQPCSPPCRSPARVAGGSCGRRLMLRHKSPVGAQRLEPARLKLGQRAAPRE